MMASNNNNNNYYGYSNNNNNNNNDNNNRRGIRSISRMKVFVASKNALFLKWFHFQL